MNKRWKLFEACPSEFSVMSGVEDQELAQVLWNRGLRTKEEVDQYLSPLWNKDQLHDPFIFRHMRLAVERVFHALERSERITVHGDYDADGVTGSTVLICALREIESQIFQKNKAVNLNSNIDYYIPHRDREGYGLHLETVRKLQERGTRLIITVDCGIACVEEVRLAKSGNMETIVVDHHQFGESLPEGFLIHPGLPDEPYPFKKLAAVGVAFKFATAILAEARMRGITIADGWEKWLLDLVAIATVTDMVPMIGENRVLETYGLQVLNKTKRPGLLALFSCAGIERGKITEETVGFMIGPRLNAAGRMDHASLALRLLLSTCAHEAQTLAASLERCNQARQEATKRIMQEAEEKMKAFSDELSIIVMWDARWSPALVGLAAGKILEKWYRPAVIIGFAGGRWVGSGRSVSGYDITDAVRTAGADFLDRVGGHPQACGFTLSREEALSRLREQLQVHAREKIQDESLIPKLWIDTEIQLERVNESFVQKTESFSPFGEGNRRPVFLSRQCRVSAVDVVGSQFQHLRLTLTGKNGKRVKMIGFKLGARVTEISYGKDIDIVYHVSMNEWQGRREPQGILVDFVCT